ncbi:flavin reductase family protein [Rhizobium sp. BK251]|uniref:flavin reductase family protein n=1 Tax=Rhizobium sp. BK251 TaxID=2512125 RepID=UPI001045D97B|nr:flavin reductase family protein [Rhizobium sp. BK251]TCL62123.1 flavin reductase (DIM6/NTAB) family NADH-FMN oxidoreductase RutF [Rhizobium sp. BK251]
MYYKPLQRNDSLSHDPFNALVVPRPIGWISTISREGVVNLAPYSYFNAVSNKPPMVLFAPVGPKDSQRNAEAMGDFVVNLVTWDLREKMNATSASVSPEISEPELVGLEMKPSQLVKPPRVAAAAAALECRWVKSVPLETAAGERMAGAIVIGEVVGIHIDDAIIVDGRIDLSARQVISRLGYKDYGVLDTIFSMPSPG